MKIVFDTEPILAFFLGEEGADMVEKYLKSIEAGEIRGYLNIVNLSEVYYILYRISPKIAEEKFKIISESKTILVQPNKDFAKEAGKIKGEYAVSLADAFALSTAKAKGGKLLVGADREFKEIQGIEIEGIRR
ncbi:MAG: type II toxin-antitoxin system VapC family toxin [Candidatus Hydrothermarchaeales archaeon]